MERAKQMQTKKSVEIHDLVHTVVLSRFVLQYCKIQIYVLMTPSRKVFNCFLALDRSRGEKFYCVHDDID